MWGAAAGRRPPRVARPGARAGLPGAARAARIADMTAPRMRAVVLAALVCGVGVIALLAASDHQGAKTVWAVSGRSWGGTSSASGCTRGGAGRRARPAG